MADEVANHALAPLKRMDAKLDRVIEDVGDLKARMSLLESNTARGFAHVHESLALLNARVDRIETRMDRIERRLDLVET